MPRYFFNVKTGRDLIVDEEGIDMDDLDQVRREAEMSARALLAGEVGAGRPIDHRSFEVADDRGQIVLTYPFRDAIQEE